MTDPTPITSAVARSPWCESCGVPLAPPDVVVLRSSSLTWAGTLIFCGSCADATVGLRRVSDGRREGRNA